MIKLRDNRRNARIADPGDEDDPIRFELFSNEQLELHAVSLAQAQKADTRPNGLNLIPRLRENSRVRSLADYYKNNSDEQ